MKLRRALAFALAATLIVPFARRAAIAQDAKAAPDASASKDAAPKKKAASAAKKKAAKRKKVVESPYKSTVLSQGTASDYRFDANGNPVGAGKKKPADKPACAADAPCADKKTSEADSL